ncbi:hypothetical protein [Amycolatopsis sp.]|uniref:hypothetical protein n=1 Tax=Amycolatopsis sp. TaxID=37632 RepID=UPI002C6BC24D|nr:hypothetical protein [Amycolatopsis sp.]HVV11631.1 hypothetical protein [Amycolatopsis sp.]
MNFHVPLPGPFTYTHRLGPSRTAGALTKLAFWLIAGPFVVAFIAIWATVWMAVAAVMIGVAVWQGIFTAIGFLRN